MAGRRGLAGGHRRGCSTRLDLRAMEPRGEFKVAITKEDLVFAAAHFITFAGHRCERLHGHNYRASIVIEGGLEDQSWYVVDFAAVKKLMRGLMAELDHRVLLPRDNPKLAISEQNGSEERRVGKECRSRWSPYH